MDYYGDHPRYDFGLFAITQDKDQPKDQKGNTIFGKNRFHKKPNGRGDELSFEGRWAKKFTEMNNLQQAREEMFAEFKRVGALKTKGIISETEQRIRQKISAAVEEMNTKHNHQEKKEWVWKK